MARSRILVVDDEPGILRVVERVLGQQHDVVCAASPNEALQLVESVMPDLAVLDIRMPEMNGFDLMARLQALDPEVDVIVMTGSITDQDAHLIRAIDEGAFYFIQKPFDLQVLRALVTRCLELRKLQQERQRHLKRLQRELAQARVFQHSMLPPAVRQTEGLHIAARSIASAELGGDFYDYASVSDDRTAILIADVSGHGASAAMMTGIVKSAFHGARADDYRPLSVVQKVADSIRAFEAHRFITCFCGLIDTRQLSFEYVNAGHPPGLHWSADAAPAWLDSTGPLISSGFQEPWSATSIDLRPQSRLLLYTDGLTEASGEAGMFGTRRMLETVSTASAHGAMFIDEVLGAIARFTGPRPNSDDMTLMAVDVEMANRDDALRASRADSQRRSDQGLPSGAGF